MLNHNVAYTGGGTFYRALSLAKELAGRGHRLTLLASSPKSILRFIRQEMEGVTLWLSPGVLPTRWRYGYDFYESWRRQTWLAGQAETFDIVHAFDSRPTVIYPALAAQRRGARLVMDWCDWFGRGGAVEERANPVGRALLGPLETYYEEAFRGRADAATIINRPLFDRALRMGLPKSKMLLLPNGSNPAKLQPIDRQAARAALNLPADQPLLGYLGSLFARDARLLLDTFERLRARKAEVQLILIGNSKAQVPAKAGVLQTGFIAIEEVQRYLAACDLLLLPLSDTLANRGRWPSKISDYFAAGRPVAACAVGDMPEVLAQSQAGATSLPDPEHFADLIGGMLDNPELLFQMGQNARRAAETRYNWAVLAGQVETLYQSLAPH